MTTTAQNLDVLNPAPKPADYASDQDIRWCPGCGDYSILMQMKKVLAKLGVDRRKTVFVSGIGCSSRFPYYLDTYGFHSIHGRAPTIATGIKLANPELTVWVATGDGDGLSIGGNHFLHAIRRNVDIKIVMFNNRIYGLTKGQYSPTTEQGHMTKSSPLGAPDYPVRPISIAIGAEATFVARSVDVDVKHLEYVLERAAKHSGTAFVEIYQNCNIFNDGAYDYLTDKTRKPDTALYLEHGKPMIFGKNGSRGIRLDGWNPHIVATADTPAADLLVHDEKALQPSLAFMLSRMSHPDFPEPMGVFRDIDRPTYSTIVQSQIEESINKSGPGDLQALVTGEDTWTVD